MSTVNFDQFNAPLPNRIKNNNLTGPTLLMVVYIYNIKTSMYFQNCVENVTETVYFLRIPCHHRSGVGKLWHTGQHWHMSKKERHFIKLGDRDTIKV